MAEHASVVRIIRFRPAPGKRDELVGVLERGAEQIRQLEGCFGIQVCGVRESPEVIASISRWASQAALDQFLQTSQQQRADLNSLAAEPPTTEHLTPV
jgi:quinol monooxygenase YgiN